MMSRKKAIEHSSNYAGKNVEKEVESMEKEFGFKLEPWQIMYIYSGQIRQTGKTTAYIIRLLIDGDTELDFRNPMIVQEYVDYSSPFYANTFKKETVTIYIALNRAGVKTRKILF